MESRIELSDGFHLTSVRKIDIPAYVEYLSDGTIASLIPAIPQPYTISSAEKWVRHRLEVTSSSLETCFAIRNPDGMLIGSVGIDDLDIGIAHNGELGYWLAPAYRGRGLATQAVKAFIEHAFEILRLDRLTAHTLVFNLPSIAVLQKVGFRKEGCLRNLTRTSTGLHDTLVFGLLKSEFFGG